MFTNKGLVEHMKKALAEGWGYVYGTIGQVLNENILQAKKAQYPAQITKYETFIRQNWMGKRTADCVNAIKSYFWWDAKKNDPVYNIAYDKIGDTWQSADGMFKTAKVKGPIDTMPEVIGLGVRFPGHIGVYIGNGQVIESRGTKYGVVLTNLKERGWTHWLEIPNITYLTTEEGLRRGAKGTEVGLLQAQLNTLGAALTEDKDFGPKTEAALQKFQADNGLEANGILDTITSQMLTKKLIEKIKDQNTILSQIRDMVVGY